MRWYFLLDENTAPRSLVLQAARDLWRAIARNRHAVIASYDLSAKYRDKLRTNRKKARNEAEYEELAKLIGQILQDSDFSHWVAPQLVPSPYRQYIHHRNDLFLADILYEAVVVQGLPNCIFVSTDRQTRGNFNRPEFHALNIRGVTIEEALKLARQAR